MTDLWAPLPAGSARVEHRHTRAETPIGVPMPQPETARFPLAGGDLVVVLTHERLTLTWHDGVVAGYTFSDNPSVPAEARLGGAPIDLARGSDGPEGKRLVVTAPQAAWELRAAERRDAYDLVRRGEQRPVATAATSGSRESRAAGAALVVDLAWEQGAAPAEVALVELLIAAGRHHELASGVDLIVGAGQEAARAAAEAGRDLALGSVELGQHLGRKAAERLRARRGRRQDPSSG